MEQRTVVVERELAHAPEKVWRTLTESALIEQWLMENDFRPVIGHRFVLRTAPQPHWNGVVDCQVQEVVPLERLSYTWNTSGTGAEPGLRTVVTFTLTPTHGGGVILRMEQAGFREHEDANFQGARYGWNRMLDALEGVAASLEDGPGRVNDVD